MKLTFKEGKGEKIHFFLDEEYKMTADRAFLQMSGLSQNQELNDEELARLNEAVSSRRAFNKACDLLEMRDHSSAELRQKLRQKGHGEHADEAIRKLIDLGLVDDERFAARYAAELANVKHFGRRRIVSELFRKGIDREIIDAVCENIEIDEGELAELVRRKFSRQLFDEKGERRTVNALVRMGYSFSEIKTAIEAVKEENENED